ncbi:hypothetical protein PSI23_15875 [Xenorhabdus sp. XENO-10]|uniref:Uncharacterized protein n=1 Tax=Xenorhabdus yunnanensis TaxID=3025878 RepID=A0ABT5LHY6_9GAMM|nr:hypothetical protein [Xenorhabdus yunnanensis]MDC9590723.1 hypothetical protein [Xenorhabdus yunnanensis]
MQHPETKQQACWSCHSTDLDHIDTIDEEEEIGPPDSGCFRAMLTMVFKCNSCGKLSYIVEYEDES